MQRILPVLVLLVLTIAVAVRSAGDVPDDVKALAQQKCTRCHKGKFPPKGLNLEPSNIAGIIDAPSREVPSLKIVDTRAPEASYLLKKVLRESGITGRPMPPGKALTAEEIQVLETWIMGLK